MSRGTRQTAAPAALLREARQPARGGSRYRMPAEWEPHAATWLAWPHNASDWPGKLAAIHWVYGEIVRRLAQGERLRLVVASPAVERRARSVLARVGVDLGQIDWLAWPTNRGWLRDSGPVFVHDLGARGSPLTICGFGFNAWARYPDWQADARLAGRAARRARLPLLRARWGQRDFVLEGGAIDVNGCGSALATEECLLDPQIQVRNPGLDRHGYERLLATYLGVTHLLWLGRGIAGDDTHGHIDDVCRFVDRRTVVLCREEDPADANYAVLAENHERLQGLRLEDGSRPQVVALPMPAPLGFAGRRLPASYANFYVGNAAVLVPTFNDPRDRHALGLLAELFPDRPVVGIHAVDLVWGLGTLHCLTQQEPLALAAPVAAAAGRAPGAADCA